jgi:hypothetical protein
MGLAKEDFAGQRRLNQKRHNAMKAPIRLCSLAAVGLAALLTSCVDPYYSGYGGASTTTTVTHYRPGYTVNTLPTRYETEVVGGVRYYHYDNVYYRPQGSRYVVVEAPRGSRGYRYDNHRANWDPRESHYDRDHRRSGYTETRVIRTLPNGYQTVTHRGTRYYRSGNVYYQSRGDGYIIVDSPY